MRYAQRGAEPPRPPWEMVGVRCPSCGLGGDIPGTVVLTVCPRCDTTFDVASAKAERPANIRGPIPLPPVPTPDLEPSAPPAAPAPTPGPPPTAQPDSQARTRPSWPIRTAVVGLALFALGVLVGWTLFGGDADSGARADSPLDVLDAAARREIADAARAEQGDRAAAGHDGSSDASATPSEKSSALGAAGAGSDRSTSTTAPSATTTTRPDPSASTSSPAASTTTIVEAAPPGALPGVRACSGLDCHMTVRSGVEGIPVPDDAVRLAGASGSVGWTTQVAGVEDLTDWYLDHLTELGWDLNAPVSVMDPSQGEARDLGHATSAVYCPSDPDDSIVAVNVGWPMGDSSGDTVVIAVVVDIADAACA